MKNVTITVDEEIARWARVEAARRGTSVSRMLGEMLHDLKEREQRYQESYEAFRSIDPRPLRRAGQVLPSREELHDRTGLR